MDLQVLQYPKTARLLSYVSLNETDLLHCCRLKKEEICIGMHTS